MSIIEQIEDVYQSINIYRSIFFYDDKNEFNKLKQVMKLYDFSFVECDTHGRVYTQDDCDIDWNSISIVFCIGDTLQQAKTNVQKHMTTPCVIVKF